MRRFSLFFPLLFATIFARAQAPEWIWHSNKAVDGETCFFRKTFSCGFAPQKANLICTADNELTVFLNGKQVAHGTDYQKPVEVDVRDLIKNGENTLAVRAKNLSGAAGLLVKLELRTQNNFPHFTVTDTSWLNSTREESGWEKPEFAAGQWTHSVSLGKLGVEPWGDVFGKPSATPAESLVVLPGFKAELIKSADLSEGSWICMTVDDQGRFIVSPEKNFPLLRLTVSKQGQLLRTEKISAGVHGAMGMVYAWDSLFVNSRGPNGMGLYRLTDKNHNDQFEPNEVELVKGFDGDSEHGCHALALGPDQKLYVMNGNHTKVPPGIASDSAHQNYAEDLLLPRMWDANGHAKDIYAPGGYVVRSDRSLKKWEMICGGFRNTYDFDFNRDGEIFTFDSDMEWDIGAPWYRPTRINHIVSGGEYGWRSGTGKWPEYYPDSLPGNLDMGYGSPTAAKFGTRSTFPAKYRDAFYVGDWALGKISAVHLRPDGATYTGTSEVFISGKPLNVSGMEFGKDGAMYFIIGGWKTQSGLYRVSYVGGTTPARELVSADQKSNDKSAAKQRALRHKLESFHGKTVSGAVDFAWPYLGNSDRWLRYAARIAVESQPAASWQKRALAENKTEAAINALLALARRGDKTLQPQIVARLLAFLKKPLSEAEELEMLRTLEVCFTRMGKPDEATAALAIRGLSAIYPAKTEYVNRELSQLLVFLDWPEAVPKTLAMMAAAPTQQEQMHYAFVLRNATTGWTMERRTNYFTWFHKALAEYQGGHSFEKYLLNIRAEAAEKLPASERKELAALIEFRPVPKPITLPPRVFVKEWNLSDLTADLGKVGQGRSFAKGKQAFAIAQCILCHRVAGDGGSVGPDLAGLSGRFNRHDLLDNILSPSKIISDRYQSYTITTRDDEELSGCIVEENDQKVVVLVDPLNSRQVSVNKSDIKSRRISKLSPMPEGLLSVLTKQQILDLLAFLESDGRPNAPAFAAKK